MTTAAGASLAPYQTRSPGGRPWLRLLILQAMARTGGVRKAAAKLLGVSSRSMLYRLAKHALEVGGPDDDDSEAG